MALPSSFRVQIVSEQRLTSWKKTIMKYYIRISCFKDVFMMLMILSLTWDKSNYPFMSFLRWLFKKNSILETCKSVLFCHADRDSYTNSLHYYAFPWPHHVGTSKRTSIWVCVIHFSYKRNVCEYRFLCILCSCTIEATSMMWYTQIKLCWKKLLEGRCGFWSVTHWSKM